MRKDFLGIDLQSCGLWNCDNIMAFNDFGALDRSDEVDVFLVLTD